MTRKQKIKKAAQAAAKVNAAKLQLKIAEGKEVGAGAEVQDGAIGTKPKIDSAYRKKLKKLMNLAEKLPNSLVIQPNSSKVQNSDAEGGSVKSTDSEDEVQNLVNADSSKFSHSTHQGQKGPTSDDGPKYSRGEKKARRLLMKLDLKRMDNVFRVTMKKTKNILLIIENPDVYTTPTGAVIIFGKALVEDLNLTAATQAAERYRDVEVLNEKEAVKKEAATVAAGAAAVDGDDDRDEGDGDGDGDVVDEAAAKTLDDKDIELVQMQATCSRKKAIKALLKNERDVVNAIMSLTMG